MTLDDYKRFYINFIVTVLGPAVKREANCDVKLGANLLLQNQLENIKNGFVVLALIALIEESFLNKGQLRALRSFSNCSPPLSPNVNAHHLSCYLYIRDCVAHNATPSLLSPGTNTAAFQAAVLNGTFSWANIAGTDISITNVDELHKIILRFFGESV